MRIAVAGATGTVGKHVVSEAAAAGHEVLLISRATGVDLVTGAGLDLAGVDAVIDASGVSTLSAKKSIAFFEAVTTHLLRAAHANGVKHFVPLSIVGAARAPHGYYAGKARQEELVIAGQLPYTIVRATQFFEFAEQNVANLGLMHGLPDMRCQPVAASAVARHLVQVAIGAPQQRAVEVAGPEEMSMTEVLRIRYAAKGENRIVVELPLPGKFGRSLRDGTLLPGEDALLLGPNCREWVATT